MAGDKRIRVAGGVGAIWTGATDTLPFTDPLNHLDRVKFHSQLDYNQIIEEHTFTLTLPARANFRDVSQVYPLMAHGKAGYPFVLGQVTVQGQPCAFTGSVPIQLNAVNGNQGPVPYARWISLGADATYVYLHEYCVAYWLIAANCGSYAQISVPIKVWITNEILQ